MNFSKKDQPLTPTMFVSTKTDLVQDVLTDCSVVASLCATTSRLERGLDKVYFLRLFNLIKLTKRDSGFLQYRIPSMKTEILGRHFLENTSFAFTLTDAFERWS